MLLASLVLYASTAKCCKKKNTHARTHAHTPTYPHTYIYCHGSQVFGFLLCLCVSVCVCGCCHLRCLATHDRWLVIRVSWCWSAAPFLLSWLLFIPYWIVVAHSRFLFSVLLSPVCSSVPIVVDSTLHQLLLRNLAILSGRWVILIAVHDLSLLPIVVPMLLRTLSAPTVFLSSLCCCRFGLHKINFCALATESRVFSWNTLT